MKRFKITTCAIVLAALVGAGIVLHQHSAHRAPELQIRETLLNEGDHRRKLTASSDGLGKSNAHQAKTITRRDDSWNGTSAKQQLEAAYSGVFKLLKLSPAKFDQLESLMIEQQEEARDVLIDAGAHGVDFRTGGHELGRIMIAAVTPINQQIHALLGGPAYEQLLNAEEALPMRAIASDLQAALSATAEPLSDEKTAQLVQTLAQYIQPNPTLVVSATLEGPLFPFRGTPIADDDVVEASAVLTEGQLAALQALQQQEEHSNSTVAPPIRFVLGRSSGHEK